MAGARRSARGARSAMSRAALAAVQRHRDRPRAWWVNSACSYPVGPELYVNFALVNTECLVQWSALRSGLGSSFKHQRALAFSAGSQLATPLHNGSEPRYEVLCEGVK